RARPERAHPGGQGVHLRHPARPPPARSRSAAPRREDARARLRRRRRMTTYPAWADTAPPAETKRMGFFTDTSVCIGCKACEVACKEWNLVPEDGLLWTGESYDNTSALGANTWRHVAFIEQRKPMRIGGDGPGQVELVATDALADVGEEADAAGIGHGEPEPLRW